MNTPKGPTTQKVCAIIVTISLETKEQLQTAHTQIEMLTAKGCVETATETFLTCEERREK